MLSNNNKVPTGNLVKKKKGNMGIFCQENGRFMGFLNKNMGGIWEKSGFIRPKLTLKTNLNLNSCT